jgi:hypothetical protein
MDGQSRPGVWTGLRAVDVGAPHAYTLSGAGQRQAHSSISVINPQCSHHLWFSIFHLLRHAADDATPMLQDAQTGLSVEYTF